MAIKKSKQNLVSASPSEIKSAPKRKLNRDEAFQKESQLKIMEEVKVTSEDESEVDTSIEDVESDCEETEESSEEGSESECDEMDEPTKVGPTVKQSKKIENVIKKEEHLLLLNFERLNEEELTGFLKQKNIKPTSVKCLHKPVAIISLADNNLTKAAFNSCSGTVYKSKPLVALRISGDISAIDSCKKTEDGSTVFVLGLAKSFKKEDIETILQGIKPQNINILSKGPKNKVNNACFIDCANPQDAQKVVNILNGRNHGGSIIKATIRSNQAVGKDEQRQQIFKPGTSLVVSNVPFVASAEDVKKEIPGCLRVEPAQKGSFVVHFKSNEEKEKAFTTLKGKQMSGRQLKVHSHVQEAGNRVFVSNLPFTAKFAEIKNLYKGCIEVTILKRKDGKPNGNAILVFNNIEAAKFAASETKQLGGRQIHAKLSGSDDLPKPQPQLTPMQVGSDDDDDEEEEEVEESGDSEEESEDEVSEEEEESDEEDAGAPPPKRQKPNEIKPRPSANLSFKDKKGQRFNGNKFAGPAKKASKNKF